MRSLQRVIAFIRTMMGGATPTQPVGPVLQEPMTQDGKETIALDIQPQLPAQPHLQKKPSRAKSTSQVAKSTSKKQKPVATAKSQAQAGFSIQTPASKTHQPVQQAKTKKQKAVGSTTQGKKHTPSKTLAQTRTVRSSKARGS